ncbi:MAG: Gldg family protein [Verrucomicrobiota bacterium]
MKHKSFETVLYSTVGVAIMLLIVVAINFMVGLWRFRMDLTEEKAYTLSAGTKAILGKLDGPVKVRFYCTQNDNNMPVPLRNYAQRIDDVLAEYKKLSGGKLQVEKLDPQPDTDAEDFANMDGVEGKSLSMGGEAIYLGVSIAYLDEKVALPFLTPERDKYLEYDLSRAISRVMNPQRPTIGIISGAPIFGTPMNPMMMQMGQQPQQQPPWMFISELERDFTVKQLNSDLDSLDNDIKVLLLIHPKNLSDKTLFAIDQYIMRGGKLVCFLDPFCAMEGRSDPMRGQQSSGSNLEKLLKTWGMEFDSSKVLVDMGLRNPRFHPRVAHLLPAFDAQHLKQDEIITSQIDNVVMAFAGAFTGTPVEGLKQDVLMKSSPNSQLVDRFMAEMSGEQVAKDFKSSGKEYNVAVRLSGKFKTAFPDGKPEDKPEGDKKDEKKPEAKKDDSLKVCKADNQVILFGDVDMLHEQFYAEQGNFFGQRVMIPNAGNLSLLQNTVELYSGDSNLVNARSRATKARYFTLIRDMQAKAAERFQTELAKLETDKNELRRKISELQAKPDAKQRFVLPPEAKAEIEKYRKSEVETSKRLKQVRKELRSEEEAMSNKLKWVNIAGMPALVTIFGLGLAVYNRKRTAAK